MLGELRWQRWQWGFFLCILHYCFSCWETFKYCSHNLSFQENIYSSMTLNRLPKVCDTWQFKGTFKNFIFFWLGTHPDGLEGEDKSPILYKLASDLQGQSHCCKVTRQLENAELGPRTASDVVTSVISPALFCLLLKSHSWGRTSFSSPQSQTFLPRMVRRTCCCCCC